MGGGCSMLAQRQVGGEHRPSAPLQPGAEAEWTWGWAGTLLCQEQEVGCVFWFEYLKLGPSQKIGGAFLFSAAH